MGVAGKVLYRRFVLIKHKNVVYVSIALEMILLTHYRGNLTQLQMQGDLIVAGDFYIKVFERRARLVSRACVVKYRFNIDFIDSMARVRIHNAYSN